MPVTLNPVEPNPYDSLDNPYDRLDQPKDDSSNFVRGAKVAGGQMMPLAQGMVGMLGATAEQAVGEGGIATAVKNWGLKGYTEGMQKLQPLAKDTDELTTAWDKAKEGNLGALVDWASYGLGYGAAQMGAAAATSVVGGLVGTAMAGPAGTVGGAVEGAVASGAVRALAHKAIAGMVEKEAAGLVTAQAAKAGVTLTAEQMAARVGAEDITRLATANVAKSIGQTTALVGYAGVQEGGSIYPEAEAQLAERNKATGGNDKLDAGDMARIWATTAGAAALEGLTDKLGLDALSGKVRLPGTMGTAARAATGAVAGAAGEGMTEAAQTVLERVGAGQEVFSPDGVKDIINSASLGAIGGGPVGAVGGALHGAPQAAVDPNAAPAPAVHPADQAFNDAQSQMDSALQNHLSDQTGANVIAMVSNKDASVDDTLDALTASSDASSKMLTDVSAARDTRAKGRDLTAAVDRQFELTAQQNAAGTEFDKQNAQDQAATALEMASPPTQRSTAPQAMEPAMDQRTAQGRLGVLKEYARQNGEDPDALSVAPHPTTPDKFTVMKAAAAENAPSSISAENAAPGISDAQAQYNLEAASMAGTAVNRKAEDEPRQVVVTNALKSIELRRGVASPAEAQIVHEAGLGKPYDSIDHTLAPALTTDQQLTQATGIALDAPPRSSVRQSSGPTDQQLQQQESNDRSDSRMAQLAREKQAAQQQQAAAVPVEQPAPPAPVDVIAAAKVIPALRTPEQKILMDQARATHTSADMAIMQGAATAPFTLTSDQRVRLKELQNPQVDVASTAATTAAPAATAAAPAVTDQATPLAPGQAIPLGPVKSSAKRTTQETLDLASAATAPQETDEAGAPVPAAVSKITEVARAALPQHSEAADGEMSQQTHKFLSGLATVFGKKLVVYESDNAKLADGFVPSDDSSTVYLNKNSQKGHLVVFGHEVLHQLKADSPEGYAAIKNVMKIKADEQKNFENEQGIKGDHEELISDLQGDMFADHSFWTDVFGQVADKSGEKTAAAVGGTVSKVVNTMIRAMGGIATFDSSKMVENMDQVRSTITSALADYAGKQKDTAKQLYAEQQQTPVQDSTAATEDGQAPGRVQNTADSVGGSVQPVQNSAETVQVPPTKSEMAKWQARKDMGESDKTNPMPVATTQPAPQTTTNSAGTVEDSPPAQTIEPQGDVGELALKSSEKRELPATGVHFSSQARQNLDGRYWGTGLKGAEASRLNRDDTDPRLKSRVYSYVDTGNGITPESGVGGIPHEVPLTNLYDSAADPLKLKGKGANAFESAVLDNGYHGYTVPDFTSQQGAAVHLGEHAENIPVKAMDSYNRGDGTTMAAAPSRDTQWQTHSTAGSPETLRLKMQSMQAKPSWQNHEMRVAGNDLQYRLKPAIAASEKRTTETPQFKQWFGQGKLTDDTGTAMPLYHGGFDFSSAAPGKAVPQTMNRGALGVGFYMSPSMERGTTYANESGGKLNRVYTNLKNPLEIHNSNREDPVVVALKSLGVADAKAQRMAEKAYETHGYAGSEIKKLALEQGHDGIVQYKDGKVSEVVAWQPTQVKSATDNNGNYSSTNPDIRQSEKRPVGKSNFEVAPDPNNKELSKRWNDLPTEHKMAISQRVAERMVPQVLELRGNKGDIVPQTGSYNDDTNPSFTLRLHSGNLHQTSKDLGHVLSQDSMVNLSYKPFMGSKKTGAIVLDIGNKNFDQVKAIYDQIRAAVPEVGGQSYSEGLMYVLNFSDTSTKELWQKIDDATNSEYPTLTRDVYASFPEKKEYSYDYGSNDAGILGEDEASLRGRLDSLRGEASSHIERELAAHEAAGGSTGAALDSPGQGHSPEGRVSESAKRKVNPEDQRIREGHTVEQSHPLSPEQWQAVRTIALDKLSQADREAALSAESKYQTAQTRADEDSVRYKATAEKALAAMPVPRLSTVPLMQNEALAPIKGTGKNDKIRVADVGRVLRKRVLGSAADTSTPQGREAIAKAMVHEALYSLSMDGHAIGWYGRTVEEALAVTALAHPKVLTDPRHNFAFRVIAAVTSNGQAVRDNFMLANDIYKGWVEHGSFPVEFEGGGTRAPAMKIAMAKMNGLVQDMGWEQTEKDLMTMRSVRDIERDFDLKISGENKDTLVPTAVGMGGPKIGNFFANLSGYFDSPTMDLWFMRTVGRMTGGLLQTKGSLVKYLDQLSQILPEKGLVHGERVDKIRAEIDKYKALPAAQQMDPDVTIKTLGATERYARSQYSVFTRADPETGKTFTDKSPENLNARSIKGTLAAMVEAPSSGTERNELRETVERALYLLNKQGIKLSAADMQAVLWYYEKNLYGKLGDISESAKPWNYATAARFGVGREHGLVDVSASTRAEQVRGGEQDEFDPEQPGEFPEGVPSDEGSGGRGEDAGVKASTKRIVGDSGRQYTVAQKAMFDKTGRTDTVLSLKEKVAAMRKDLGKRMAQGIADQFAPIKELGGAGYMLARLSKGSAGAVEAFLQHGKLSIKDGAYDADRTGGVIEKVFQPLHGEAEDFLWWVAAHRAQQLTDEDRENLFTPSDIAAGKSLSDGTTKYDYTLRSGQVTRDRTLIFRDAAKNFDEFNKNAMDMAEQSGLIDGSTRKFWEHEFYVPFYRASEDAGGFVGGALGQALVRQTAFKRLKGGENKLHSDLMANTLQNWSHLIDAAAKNRAALATLDAAVAQGAAIEANQATIGAMGAAGGKAAWVLDGGQKRHFLVEDPYLLTAIQSLESTGMKGPLMTAMASMKHWLTVGVTASPAFKIRNLIRDSIQAVSVSDLGYDIAGNIKQGIKASSHDSQTYVSALASGGLIRFGTMLEGNASARVRQLVKMGVDDSTILNSQDKLDAMRTKFEKAFMAYTEIGNRGEEINRAALYEQLIAKGVPHGEAALQARDLMDFSMQGSFTSVRFLTQVVPFMNARIQGLYKLGKGAKEDPAKFATVLGAVGATSLALLAAYHDDDDWKKREDWDRDNYWWFKIGGIAYRIPKPFEIGAVATAAERGVELFTNKEMTSKRFLSRIGALLGDNLNMNPVPQAVKPIIDLYANKDSFSGRPIETMGMEKVDSQHRFTAGTSMVARGASTAAGGLLSPVQVDHLIQGYFSWLGATAVAASDMIIRPMTNEPTRPTADYFKIATQGMASEVPSGTSRYVTELYDQAKVMEEAYGTWRSLLKQGKNAEARDYFTDNRAAIQKYGSIEGVKRAEAQITEQIRMIERSAMSPDTKKQRIQQMRALQDRMARTLTAVN